MERIDHATLREAGAVIAPTASIIADSVDIGPGSTIGAGSVIVGDRVAIGSDVVIGAGADLRAGDLRLGDRTEIASGAKALCAEEFSVGVAGRIASAVEITCRSFRAGRLLYVGERTMVGFGGTRESTAHCIVGDRVTIGPANILNANCEIRIGSGVGTGAYVSLWTHGYHFGHSVLDGYAVTYEPVHVGEGVWLGFHCTLLPGVSVGNNSIVAGGALLTRSVGAGFLVAGVPAVMKKRLSPERVTGAAALAIVEGIVARWARELEWKGWAVRADSARRWLVRSPEDEAAEIILVADDEDVGPSNASARMVVLSVEDRAVENDITLFELRAGRLSGPLDDLVEDLRDHLRRNSLPCGDDTCFRTLPIPAFDRLVWATEVHTLRDGSSGAGSNMTGPLV